MNVINQICRFLLGGLFIFSGAVKLNDPYGTANMMEEYFEVFAADFGTFFHHFVPYSIYFSVLICAFEIVLGIAILLQYRMNKTMWAALLLNIYFTFLTFYSFYYDKVKECGCFGTVIIMTPKESFYKNLITLIFVGYLFTQRKKLRPVFTEQKGDALMLGTTVFVLGLGYYITQHLPLFDTLAYRPGNNIPKLMQPEEKAQYKWILEKEGKEFQFSDSNYPTDTTYKYKRHELVGDSSKLIPKIVGLRIDGEDGDATSQAFEGNRLFIIIPYLDHARSSCKEIGCMDKITALVKHLNSSKEAEVFVLTGHANASSYQEYRHEMQLAAPFYFVDETILKTMVRANPGLMLLKNGVVLDKWHHNDTPTPQEISALLQK